MTIGTSPAACGLHVLHTFGPLATKVVGFDDDGSLVVLRGYDGAGRFRSRIIPLNGADDLFAACCRLEHRPRAFIVRGERLENADPQAMRRLVHPKCLPDGTTIPSTLRPKARRSVFLDLDRIIAPDMPDPRERPEEVAERLRRVLPSYFRDIACWCQFTASTLIRPGVSMRMAFWLDRPLDDAEAARLLAGAPVDLATTRAAQPIYLSQPVFVGGAVDPLPRRSFVLPGRLDTVAVPNLPPPPAARPSSGGVSRLRSGTQGGTYAQTALRRECDAVVAAADGGRHRRLNAAAFALGRFIAVDALTAGDVVAGLLWAARRAGLAEPEAELRRFIGCGLYAGITRAGR